jgi:hypothetical protein
MRRPYFCFSESVKRFIFREGLDRLSRTSRDLPDGQARGRPTESQEAHAKGASSPREGARNRLRADPSRLRGAGAGSRGDVPAIISRTLRLPLFELQPSLCHGGRVIHLRRGCLGCDKPPQRQGGWPAATFCAWQLLQSLRRSPPHQTVTLSQFVHCYRSSFISASGATNKPCVAS